MKNLILFILLIFVIQVEAQQTTIKGKEVTIIDSLYYSDAGGDSSDYILWIGYESLPQLFLVGNANSPADSVMYRTGRLEYNANGTLIDTVWGDYGPLKDSSYTTVQVAVNNTTGKDYMIFKNKFQIIEVILFNDWDTLNDRVVYFGVVTEKK